MNKPTLGQTVLAYEAELRAVKRTAGTLRFLLNEVIPEGGSVDMQALRKRIQALLDEVSL